MASSIKSTKNEVWDQDSHPSFTFTSNMSIWWPGSHTRMPSCTHTQTHTHTLTNWVIHLVHCKGDWAWMGLQWWSAEYQTLITGPEWRRWSTRRRARGTSRKRRRQTRRRGVREGDLDSVRPTLLYTLYIDSCWSSTKSMNPPQSKGLYSQYNDPS